jgi:hypothetical protein
MTLGVYFKTFSVLISSQIYIFIIGLTENPPSEKLICQYIGKM